MAFLLLLAALFGTDWVSVPSNDPGGLSAPSISTDNDGGGIPPR
jgi:hypothetical protein